MPTRRRLLCAVGAAGTTALAGCQGLIKVTANAAADPAVASESSVDDAGYEQLGTKRDTLATEVSAFPYVAEFEAKWWLARYRKELPDDEIARFEVLSSPTERAKGTQLNPIPKLEYQDLVKTFSESTGEGDLGDAFSAVLGRGDFADVERVETTDRELLGAQAEFGVLDATFTGAREGSDEPVSVTVHVAAAERDGDVVVPVGVYPCQADEAETVYRLIDGLEHPAAKSDTADETNEGSP